MFACNAGLHLMELLGKVYMKQVLDLSLCNTVNMPRKIEKGYETNPIYVTEAKQVQG